MKMLKIASPMPPASTLDNNPERGKMKIIGNNNNETKMLSLKIDKISISCHLAIKAFDLVCYFHGAVSC